MVIHGQVVRNILFYLSGVLIKPMMVRLLHFCFELHKNVSYSPFFIDDLFNEKHQNMELNTLITYFFAIEYVIFKTI